MKKFFAILAVAAVFTACNSGSDETKNGDSTGADTNTVAPTPAPVTPDTTNAGDTANKAAAGDTTKKAK